MKLGLLLAMMLGSFVAGDAQMIGPLIFGPTQPSDIVLRDELEKDSSIVAIECWRRSNKPNQETARVRLLAFETAQTDYKIFKMKQVCTRVEGAFIKYFFIENGRARMIADSTRTSDGYGRALEMGCNKLEIGTYVPGKNDQGMIFTPVSDIVELGGKMPFFKCYINGGNYAVF